MLAAAIAAAAVWAAGLFVPPQAPAPPAYTRADAEKMAKKLDAIVARGETAPAPGARPVRTALVQQEVNAYLRFHQGEFMPVGVVDPAVFIQAGNRLEARAIVDLDAVRESRERGRFDPMRYLLAGSLEVRAAGTLQAAAGRGTFAIESATLGGVPIPKTLLQELVTYYTRTPDAPAGFNLDAPFDLPANIRTVEIRAGLATIVQ